MLICHFVFQLHPAFKRTVSELCHLMAYMFDACYTLGVRLREELVGIADDLLLDSLRQKILGRQRQAFQQYLCAAQSAAGVPFSHTGMTGQSFLAQYLRADESVADIRLISVA